MSTIKFVNSFMPASLSTDHAASSYGIPVLVDVDGKAYGPLDTLPDTLGLPWLNAEYGLPEVATAGDLVRVHIINGFDGTERQADLIEAANKFLSAMR